MENKPQKRQLVGKRLTPTPTYKGGQIGNQNAKGGKGGPGAPPGNRRPLTHGFYTDAFTEGEKEDLAHVKMGNVHDELLVARTMLARGCRAQLMWERQKGIFNEQVREGVKAALGSTVAAELFHVESVEIKEGMTAAYMVKDGEEPMEPTPVQETKVIRRKTDFSAEILKYAKLIMALEETQLRLMDEGSGEDYARKLAEDIREFGDAAMALMPGNNYQRENV
jgi:hypothetical protein